MAQVEPLEQTVLNEKQLLVDLPPPINSAVVVPDDKLVFTRDERGNERACLNIYNPTQHSLIYKFKTNIADGSRISVSPCQGHLHSGESVSVVIVMSGDNRADDEHVKVLVVTAPAPQYDEDLRAVWHQIDPKSQKIDKLRCVFPSHVVPQQVQAHQSIPVRQQHQQFSPHPVQAQQMACSSPPPPPQPNKVRMQDPYVSECEVVREQQSSVDPRPIGRALMGAAILPRSHPVGHMGSECDLSSRHVQQQQIQQPPLPLHMVSRMQQPTTRGFSLQEDGAMRTTTMETQEFRMCDPTSVPTPGSVMVNTNEERCGDCTDLPRVSYYPKGAPTQRPMHATYQAQENKYQQQGDVSPSSYFVDVSPMLSGGQSASTLNKICGVEKATIMQICLLVAAGIAATKIVFD